MATLVLGVSAGGIGSSIAKLARAAGKQVHVAGRNPAVLKDLREKYGVTTSEFDATCETSIKDAVSDAVGHYGGLGSLAYCVGNVNLKPLSKIDAAGMLETFNINVVGAALAVKHAKTALTDSAETGSVVLFSSVAASQGFPMHVEIGSSKAAVQGLTISLAAELAGKVRVNCIAPSLTATPLASRLLSNEAMLKAIKAAHPIPRVGNPDEMAELAEFLMSSKSGWMTGQVLGVDGGRSTLRHKNQ